MNLLPICSKIWTLVSWAVEWMVNFADYVVKMPILLLFVVAVPLVGLGAGLLKRVLST